VQGASAADLERLLALGLIAPQPDQMPVPVPVPVAAGATLQQALQARSHSELYELLTVQARPRLGLIKGYKMVLDIERCGDAESLRALALRFVDAVRTARGDAAAGEIGRLLGAGR
ncbi:MAG: hypothetical protein KGI35_13625, partial [Burkholderiales bacterium]|nr:hypothetical protein [Burkholderiales bacterium]